IKVTHPDLNLLLAKYLFEKDIALHINPARNCIYQAALNCIRLKKDDEKIIDDQMIKYRKEFYPENNGLVSCGILYRRHTKKVEEFNNYWWHEIKFNSRRDQLSFNYVAWKTGIEFYLISGHVTLGNVDGFTYHFHKK
ncbi:MAG: glycosyltransferase domain-containing protein, partial [Bacteroidales bacterium]